MRRGSVGPAVVALQKAVGVTADGAFGPLTEAAVRAYQARHHLPVTGIAGPSTWAALMGVTSPTTTTASRSTSRPAPAPKPATTTTGPLLRLGARGDAVKTLQRALGGVAVDGLYGTRTLAAVQAFQKSAHLPVTGIADAGVWRALDARAHPLRAEYGVVLRVGSQGSAVSVLQRALRVTADGVFGPGTQAAVKALQQRAKLASTGVVATLTWQALEAELR